MECTIVGKFSPLTDGDELDEYADPLDAHSFVFGRPDHGDTLFETDPKEGQEAPESPVYDVPYDMSAPIDIPKRRSPDKGLHYSLSPPLNLEYGASRSPSRAYDVDVYKRQTKHNVKPRASETGTWAKHLSMYGDVRSPPQSFEGDGILPTSPPLAEDSKRRRRMRCVRCRACLMDLKRQALRLLYPDDLEGDTLSVCIDSSDKLEENLQVSEDYNNFVKNEECELCESHVSQLKSEAAAMVLSIQQAQSESTTVRSGGSSGSINHGPVQSRKTFSPPGSQLRYSRQGKCIPGSAIRGGNSLIPIPSHLKSTAWASNKQGQMLVRSNPQEKPHPGAGEMHTPIREHPIGQYAQFSPPGAANFLSVPYMQAQSIQQLHQQHYQQQQQQQQFQQQQYIQYRQQQQHVQQQQQQHGGSYNIHQSPQHGYHQQYQASYQQPYQPQFYPASSPSSPRIASPPPRSISRIASPPPPSSPSRVMSPPPPSASAAASFFTRAAQKLSKKKKRHQHLDPEPPPFPTSYHEILRLTPPPCPPCLLRNSGRSQVPGVGKVKVMLRLVSSSQHGDQSSSFLNVDSRNKQITVYDPAGSGYATSVAHRRAAMAPKMFAFDGVFSPDDSLAEVCAGSLTEIIQDVVSGVDGCLFTYGYSRLGKTYTMIGKDDSQQTLGIVPCAISWLFKLINEQKDQTGARFSVRVSAVEVSGKQEVLKDLLAEVAQGTETGVGTAPGVYLREDPISGTQLENQSELRAPNAERAAYYLDAALAARTQTDEAEGRSSHVLFTIHVYQYRIEKSNNRAGLPGVAGGRSRLHLIDLGSSSKSKDPNNVALSLSALGNVIMALLNGQRHVPHRDSKVAQLLRDSLGNISSRTCMIAHVSTAVPHYNESLQVIQLAARIHRMRRRKIKFASTSSDDSSTDDGRIRTRPLRGFRMGTLREDVQYGSSLSDPDYTSSSEQSCDTVIYLGANGQSLSDRELTDHEGPPRHVPRTNPRLPRRASGSRSSGDEGSNSDSGRSLYRSHESLTRIQTRYDTPVRDVSVTGNSRHGTPVRDSLPSSRNATPVREIISESSIQNSPPSPGVTFLPRKSNIRTKTSTSPKMDSCYSSTSVVEKPQPRTAVRSKRTNSESASVEKEQWIDGPGAAIYPENKQTSGEQWVDGPSAFMVKPEPKKFKKKISSEEMWVDGPREMIAEPEKKTPSPSKAVMHTTSKKAHVRSLSQEKQGSPTHQSSSPSHQVLPTHHLPMMHQTSPTQHRAAAKSAWPLDEIKERPESTISLDSNTSNMAQAPDSRPVSMVTNSGGDIEDVSKATDGLQDTSVKPFVRDWVEKHGVTPDQETDKSLGFIMNADNQVIGTLETAASYRRSKPQDARTKKLVPLSSTPKHTPHHSPRNSPSTLRRSRSATPKLQKSQLPAPSNPTKRVSEWLKSVENNQPEETIYKETSGSVMKDTAINTDPDQEFELIVANMDVSQDLSTCSSSVYPNTTASQTHDMTDSSHHKTFEQGSDCGIGDVSFDSSVDTNCTQNRESIYELQMDAQLEKALHEGLCKASSEAGDDETFSNASCKDSDMDVPVESPFDVQMNSLKKSDTVQSIKTLVGDPLQDNASPQAVSDIHENPYSVAHKSELSVNYEDLPQPLSRKPDGASNPNLLVEGFSEKTSLCTLQEEYQCATVLSSQPEMVQKSLLSSTSYSKSNTLTRAGEGDGQTAEGMKKDKMDQKSSSAKPPIPLKVCSKCGYSPQTGKPTASKMCKDCQKTVAAALKSSQLARKDKSSKQGSSHVSSNAGSPNGSSSSKNTLTKSSKSQSPSHSHLPVFLSKNSQSLKDAKASRKKEKESKRIGNGRVNELTLRTQGRGQDSDSGNDSGIVTMEKNLLSPYATVTKPRTVSHSSSGHGSDNSSTMSTDLHSKQGSLSDKLHGGTSSGYESMLRDSEGSGSTTAQEDSASELSSGEKKKKKRLPSTRRSRSAPARSSESPESSSRKSSPSSKNSSLSPASKAWHERHKGKEEPLEIKDYDADDVKRMQRHRMEEDPQILRRNHERIKDILSKPDQELPSGKDQYLMDRSNWSFDCKFLMCFSCRSRKTDV